MYTALLSCLQMKDSSYFPRLPFCLKLMLICIVWGLLGYCRHNKHCDFPTGFLSSVWNGSHEGIWNNHCNTTVPIMLFFCLLSLPSSSQAPPIIWLASSKFLCEPPARYSLLPHCISRVPCPRNFQDLGLNQWAAVARGCIKKTIELTQWGLFYD